MPDQRYDRQSFLGRDSEERIAACRLGLAGLGGGGSHIIQQCAHVGFKNYEIYDADHVEDVNLNRNVGMTVSDVAAATRKIEIAKRGILNLQPDAQIDAVPERWQNSPDAFKRCDIVFGCLDGFSERQQLEAHCRRYMIPYIDIGMDVHLAEGDPAPTMAGQVILSMPGSRCMRCIGFLTEENLAKEAAQYGAAGGRPQVVWPNGVLASTAVGIAVDLLTDWTKALRDTVYLLYYGNTGQLVPHNRLPHLGKGPCPHYPMTDVGDPVFKPI